MNIEETLISLGVLAYLLCSCTITAKVGGSLQTVSLGYSFLRRLSIFLWRLTYIILVLVLWPLKLLWHYLLKS
jgi:hypothetical protein